MAHEKQHWQDALQAAKSDRGGQDDRANQREQKKKSRLMFRKRKLDKDVKKYIKGKKYNGRIRINSSDIDAIGRRHGFQCYDMEFDSGGDR